MGMGTDVRDRRDRGGRDGNAPGLLAQDSQLRRGRWFSKVSFSRKVGLVPLALRCIKVHGVDSAIGKIPESSEPEGNGWSSFVL